MDFVPAIATIALILKLIDFARYARAGDANGVITQLVTWGAAVIVFILAAQTNWASQMIVGGVPMSQLGIWSLVFYGLSTGSAASVAKDTLKAVDNSNSAAIPTLLPVKPSSGEDVG